MTRSTASQTVDIRSLSQLLDKEIQAYLQSFTGHGVDPPSFKYPPRSSTGSTVLEVEAAKSKQSIIHSCEKIVALLRGPALWLTIEASGHLTSAAISIALKLGLPSLISSNPNAPTGLDELAKATGASQELLMRVLRVLTQRFIFEETAPLYYIQNAVSKSLTTPVSESFINLSTTDFLRSSASLLDVLTEHSFQIPVDSQHSAFSKAFQTNLSMYDYYRLKAPERGRQFALAMSGRRSGPHTLYPYDSLPAGAQVIDVGGGSGHISAPLARKHPHLKFIVQDSEDTIEYGQSVYGSEGLPVEWQETDFFSIQPVKGAEIYLLRHILVDHPDHAAANILTCIADAMDKKSRILVEDAVVPDEYGEDSNRLLNVIDMHLLSLFNSKERSMEQWKSLLGSVRRGLEIVKVWRADNTVGGEALLEIKLKQ